MMHAVDDYVTGRAVSRRAEAEALNSNPTTAAWTAVQLADKRLRMQRGHGASPEEIRAQAGVSLRYAEALCKIADERERACGCPAPFSIDEIAEATVKKNRTRRGELTTEQEQEMDRYLTENP